MKEYCYLNGKMMPVGEAKIPVTDVGVLRGYALFDSIAAVDGRIIFFDEHYRRFRKSAEIMYLKVPITKRAAEVVIRKLLKKNRHRFAQVRMVLAGGRLKGSLDFDRSATNFFILVGEACVPAAWDYRRGVKLVTCEHRRELPRAKTNNYITAISVQPSLLRKGAIEVLYTFEGRILEASVSNFFIIKGNRLVTPKKDILLGIVRGKVIGLAKRFMKVEERDVKMSELRTADEAFLTSTYKKVLPVVRVNNIVIGNGKVGPKTKLLMERYAPLEEEGAR